MTAIADPSAAANAGARKTFLGHPRGLVILFFAEMWERFSFYGMRNILVLYLLWHFLMSESGAYELYYGYAALVYLGPLLGGYLADRYLGFRKAVVFGGVLLVIGHALMGFHGAPAREYFIAQEDGAEYELLRADRYDREDARQIRVGEAVLDVGSLVQPIAGAPERVVTFWRGDGASETLEGVIEVRGGVLSHNILLLALSFVVAGVGFLKGNISTCVGALYDQGDPRRDSGFTLYYMGINLGSLLAALTVGGVAFAYGWGPAFGLAAVGMLAGLVVFVLGQGWLEGRAEPPAPDALTQPIAGGLLNQERLVYLAGLGLVAASFLLLQVSGLLNQAIRYGFLLTALIVIVFVLTRLSGADRDRMIALTILTVASAPFWALFEQAPSSLTVFAADYVSEDFFGLTMNAAQLQAWNPLFIIVFAIPLALLWGWLGARGWEPSAAVKFGLALILIGSGFWVLWAGIATTPLDAFGEPARIAITWIALMYLLHTLGELLLSPVGLSAVTKLSAPQMAGFMMGLWFFAISAGQALGEILAQLTAMPDGAPASVAMLHYGTVYAWLGVGAAVLGGLLLAASPFMRSLSHGRD